MQAASATRRRIAGICQLPLNVFNAAVEARKRSERRGRSVGRSAALPPLVGSASTGGDGAVWAACWLLLLLLRVPLSTSVSVYTYREVLPLLGRLAML